MEDLNYIKEEKNVIFEVLQDFIFLDCIFSTKKQLTRIEDKMVLAIPAFFGLSVFLYELSHENCIFNKYIDSKYQPFLLELRTLFLKQVPTVNSDIVKSTVSDMGIDWDKYAFDIVITSDSKGEIYDINFSSFNLEKLIENNSRICEELVMFPRLITEVFFNIPGNFDTLFIDALNDSIQKKIAEGTFIYNAKRKSYATSLLFNNSTNLTNQEKYYILYRYSLIKAVALLNDIPELKFELPNITDEYFICTTYSAIKLRAMVICLLGDRGNDFQNQFLKNTPLIIEIKDAVNKVIDNKDFFKKNREIRDNIHYIKTQKISNDDYTFVKNYQELYFEAVLGVFEKYLSVDFGLKYEIDLSFAKLRHWAEN